MVEFTLLKVNVQDASFRKGGERESDGSVAFEPAAEDQPPEDGGSSKGTVLAALVGLAFLAAVAYLAKTRFMSDDADGEYEYDRTADTAEEYEYDTAADTEAEYDSYD